MRLLVVEDEPNIASYVRRGLEESGHAVDSASGGGEALDWAATVDYDLIILDIMLPEIDGLEVCRRLRQRGCRSPILLLTARQSVDDRVTGLDAGADDYLDKPFALEELLARVRALGRRTGDGSRDPVWRLADLTLDTRTRQVERAGRAIDLTAKEFAVLECLVRHAGSVVTRAQIAERVWDYDSYRTSNVVDVYIRSLRRKLDDPSEVKLIHTVRGVGYRLSEGTVDEAP